MYVYTLSCKQQVGYSRACGYHRNQWIATILSYAVCAAVGCRRVVAVGERCRGAGRKLGDVVEGSGDLNAVNLYDVDMILHAAVDKTRYIWEDWRVYADVDSDGDIRLPNP